MKYFKSLMIVPVLAAGISLSPAPAKAYPMYQLAPRAKEGAAMYGFSQGSTSRSGSWITAIGIGIMLAVLW